MPRTVPDAEAVAPAGAWTPAAAIWSSLPTVARAILDPPSWNSRLGTHQGVSDTWQTYVRRACAVKAEPQDVGLEGGRDRNMWWISPWRGCGSRCARRVDGWYMISNGCSHVERRA